MVTVRVVTGLCLAVGVGCAEAPPVLAPVQPQVIGSGLLIDLSPANRPALVGALDFDLLAAGAGKACVDRGSLKHYWVAMDDLSKISPDPLTTQAIAAAVTDAVARLEDVDAILLTRVFTDSRGPDQVCATIVGRGVRLTKAEKPVDPTLAPTATRAHE